MAPRRRRSAATSAPGNAAHPWGWADRLGGALEVAADLVGDLVDPLLGLHQRCLGPGGALGGPPLLPGRLPAGPLGPRRPPEQSHDPFLSVRDPVPQPAPCYPPTTRPFRLNGSDQERAGLAGREHLGVGDQLVETGDRVAVRAAVRVA